MSKGLLVVLQVGATLANKTLQKENIDAVSLTCYSTGYYCSISAAGYTGMAACALYYMQQQAYPPTNSASKLTLLSKK